MGCSIKAIYDDYDDYTAICKALKIEPLAIRDSKSFYDHEKEILEEWNCDTSYEFWEEYNFKTLMYVRYY